MPVNALRDKGGRYLKGTQAKSDEERFWSYVEKTDSCWIWKGRFVRKGYGSLFFKGKETRAHRASWMIHYGDIPEGLHVCHTCDNPECTNPNHLWLGTNYENRQDSVKKGRARGGSLKGSASPNSKLTEEKVLAIRKLYASKEYKQRELAVLFNVDPTTISDIIRRKIWKHI